MSYLASTNNVFGALASKTPLNRPVQYNYTQSVDSAVFPVGFAPMKKSMFQFDAGSTNVVDDLFVADMGNSAVIKLPITGIWTISMNTRFNAGGAENSVWFTMNSKFYNEAFGSRRLGFAPTPAAGINTTVTSYFDAGDLLAMNVYSTVQNKLVSGFAYLTVTLVQPTAARMSATPIVPPVVTS